uniref:Ig-like domain-containing protein n=1 Tax=Seriola dumerili TaxID=41447 RepID=A0A3B4VBB1_SERDU
MHHIKVCSNSSSLNQYLNLCYLQPLSESVQAGGSVSLNCTVHTGTSDGEHSVYCAKNLCWYKQVAGEQPQIISSFYKHSFYNIFYNQFKDDKRFSVHTGAGFYHLNISNVQDSDSAMYYCGQTSITVTEFSNGTFLVVKGDLLQVLDFCHHTFCSVSLNGTVHTGTSDGEHSVYWFRKDTGKSHLGILYVHTHSSSRCVKAAGSESPAQSRCVYNLWRRSVSLSDAGTYYCAVASCGEILFGEGTRLEVEGEQNIISTCSPSFHVIRHPLRLHNFFHQSLTLTGGATNINLKLFNKISLNIV